MNKTTVGNTNLIRGKITFITLVTVVLIIFQFVSAHDSSGENSRAKVERIKILHIMSYHAPWRWTDDQFNGFKFALREFDIEYKIFQMDTKRRSSLEWKQRIGKEAGKLIDSWRPDLVYTNDDNAQEYVAKYYVDKGIPFVFSGVNAVPEKYGFVGSQNITGVLEQEHFVPTVKLLKDIAPDVKKIAIILDDGPTWPGVVKRMQAQLDQLPEIEIVSWDIIKTFKQFTERMNALQKEVDAVGLLGIFTYKDENGNNVNYTDVLKWTAENSRLPDFSFWASRISCGTLCAVSVSGYEQGLAAGKIARGVLTEGRTPSSYPMRPTLKGEPIVSLARAKKLGIALNTDILLTADVIEKFNWEK